MSALTKQERRKQKKQRQEKRRKAAQRGKNRQPQLTQGTRQPSAKEAAPPRPPAGDLTSIDSWWEFFEAAPADEQLRMLRDKLEAGQPDEEWHEVITEAIHDLESDLSAAQYVAFLEELRTKHPDTFAERAGWHARSMTFFYIAEERWEDLDNAIRQFANEMDKVGDGFFSTVSLLRLAGRQEAAQRLIDRAVPLLDNQDFLPWAVNRLIEGSLFARYQACVQAGATDEAIDEVYRYSLDIGCRESKETQKNQRDFALRLAGKTDAWTRDELLKNDPQTNRRVYLLTVDFMRWLCMSRGFEPVVADELRRILVSLINGMEGKPNALLQGLRRKDFEPAVAKKLDFMSLDTADAPAGIIAMQHFYDFLAETELVDAQQRETARKVLFVLWNDLKRVMKDEWWRYKFLEQYHPRANE